MGGWIGIPGSSFYHASKFAMEGWTEAFAKELSRSWNSKFSGAFFLFFSRSKARADFDILVHLSNIEPGGVKTNHATSSLRTMEKRHLAYSDPELPTNTLLRYIQSEQRRSIWAEPGDIAAAIHTLISQKRIPIHIPLGPDA